MIRILPLLFTALSLLFPKIAQLQPLKLFNNISSSFISNHDDVNADHPSSLLVEGITKPNAISEKKNNNVVFFDSIIINKYTPVISFDPCNNSINVENASDFNIGDTVLLIQMKGAEMDSSNTATFGTITDYRNAGNYEYNYVKAKSGNNIEMLNVLNRAYDIPTGKVQLVRVPYYHSVTFSQVLTCAAWDGIKGGVLALNVRDTLLLAANIDISERGFRGGMRVSHPFFICDIADFFVTNTNGSYGAVKGESVINTERNFGRGRLGSGGGGGNSHNSGGAGGGNGGSGGGGGNQYDHQAVCTSGLVNGGIGGAPLNYSNAENKIFMGGGGGAGQDNENRSVSGGSGGALGIINARILIPNSNRIILNGGSPLSTNTGPAEDGKSAGGAGGTILLNNNNITSVLSIEARGGNGDKVVGYGTVSYVGPGGGGGGGVIWVNTPFLNANITSNLSGGINGGNINYGNNPWGATSGTIGQVLNNLVLPPDNAALIPNIDSVRFNFNPTACRAFNFDGTGFTNTNPIATYTWDFGDGATANTQNTSHTFSSSGTFNVKLIVTDINGCRDSIVQIVNTNTMNAFAGNDANICTNNIISYQLTGSGGSAGDSYSWQPAALLNDPNIANPSANVTTSTTFYLTITSATGCIGSDSVRVNINPEPVIATFNDTSFCANTTLQLNSTVTGASSYTWSPATAVSNPTIPNPIFTGTANQTITLTATNGTCTTDSSFTVTIKSVPTVATIPDSTLCGPQAIVLTSTGAQTYSWSPAMGLSNPNISNPIFTGNTNSVYTVTGTATNSCSSTDVVNITLVAPPTVSSLADTSVCDNIILNLHAAGANSYSWSPATSVSNPNIANPIFTGTSGTQSLTVTGSSAPGCFSSVSFTVTVNASPVVTTIPDSSICNNQSIVLTSTGAQTYFWSPATYLSNPNISNPVFAGSSGNTYTVTGTNANGCSNSDVVVINVTAPANFVAPPNAVVCINKTIQLNGNNGNNVTYQWSPATGLSNSNTINPTFTPTTAGTIALTLLVRENICNSSASFPVNVEVNRLPTVNASRSNDIDCATPTSELNATGASSYLWTPSNTLNNASIAAPIANPTVNTTYTVIGIDNNGCENSAAIEVKVSDKERGYYVPNSFTPNGDGLNDCFGVKQWGNVADLYFIIYNRWGEKVFETRNVNICWDGLQKGSPADPGNYVYYITSKSLCGDQVRKGNVLLIR